jgi:riboflavin-specific deaminase-like protein
MKLFPPDVTPSINVSEALLDGWAGVPDRFRQGNSALPAPWQDIFGPLRRGGRDSLMVVAQIGQSIDGRVATNGGRGETINGAAGLDHLHRLRSLVDAVVIGVGTAVADDPQLTVRRVAGPNPTRVVIDPRGRLPASARFLADDGVPRIVIAGTDATPVLPRGVDVLRVLLASGQADPAAILAVLAKRGLRRILIEGGSRTLSGFLAAGCLDRLHVMVAPMLLGAGQASIDLPGVTRAKDALRPPVRAHVIDDEVLFDVDLSHQRVAIA